MAATRYATSADLTVPDAALEDFTSDQINEALDKASEEADGYLTSRFAMPLTEWGGDLKGVVGAIATYRLMSKRGFQPGGEDAEQLRAQYKDAIAWLDKVVAGKVSPIGVVDSSPGGANNTDAAGEQIDGPFVTQAYPAGGEIRDDFWDRGSSAPGATSGVSRNRGW